MESSPQSPQWSPPPAPDSGDADLFDYQKLRDQAGYVLGAIKRHKLLVLGLAGSIIAVTAGTLAVLPRTYHCESKLLASHNQIIAMLGNPGRAITSEADMPLRAASATVLRHDNLVSIVKQTDLVDRWPEHRSPLLQLKDRLRSLVRPPPDRESQLQLMVGLLTTRIDVTLGDGTVTLGVDWQDDAEMSCRLVDAAEQNFLEARHAAEISTITEAISILEDHALDVRKDIDASVSQLREAKAVIDAKTQKTAKHVAAPRPLINPPDGAVAPKSAQVVQLEALLEAKRRAIRELEDFQRTRMQDLQKRLADQKAVFSESHPAVVEVQQRIDELQRQQPAELATLHDEERELQERLRAEGGSSSDLPAAITERRLGPLPGHIVRIEQEARESDDPVIEHVRGELSFAMTKYSSLLDRIDSARMELDTSRAAFKYRYTIVVPSEVPRNPTAPNAPKILLGGIFAAILVSVLAAAATDLRSGRLLERWQAERQLGLEVLAEVDSP